jgi:hypothetical protein
MANVHEITKNNFCPWTSIVHGQLSMKRTRPLKSCLNKFDLNDSTFFQRLHLKISRICSIGTVVWDIFIKLKEL